MNPDFKPVFVVGVMRSGTSLLYSLLNLHPGMALMYEGDVWNFPRVFSGLRFRNDWLARQEFYNKCLSRHRLAWVGSRRGLESVRSPDALYETYARLKPAPLCGEKSPHYCSRLEQLHRLYPEAAFVILWRDPAESYRSTVKAGRKSLFFGKRGMLSRLIHHQEQVIQQAARIEARGARVFRVNYAELVDQTEKVCRQICTFLGLEFDPRMLRLDEADLSAVYQDAHHEFLRRGVIERQPYREELLTPAISRKLSGYRTRWERLQANWLGSGKPNAGPPEPGWLERRWDAACGRWFNFYDGGVRLGFEFLPLSWLLTYRHFKCWLFSKPMPSAAPPSAAARHRSDHAPSIIVALLYLVALVGVHLHADPHLMFLPLYMLPCVALVLVTNLRWATLFAIMCAIIASWVQRSDTDYQSLRVMLWNSSMRFLVIETLVLLFARIRMEMAGREAAATGTGLP